MASCKLCGTKNDDSAKYCSACGAPLGTDTQSTYQSSETQSGQSDIGSKIAGLNDTEDTTSEFDMEDIQKNKIVSAFSYLSWLVLVPIFGAPDSRFARYHANQGLILFIIEIIWGVAQTIVTGILAMLHLGFLIGFLQLVNLAICVLAVIGIINVVNGKAKELPVVGGIRILK